MKSYDRRPWFIKKYHTTYYFILFLCEAPTGRWLKKKKRNSTVPAPSAEPCAPLDTGWHKWRPHARLRRDAHPGLL